MSTVVFVGQKKPEKHLVQEYVYKYHLDAAMKDKILEDMKKHLNNSLDQFIIDFEVKVTLKEYDTKNTGV
jgi:hypothetical protein